MREVVGSIEGEYRRYGQTVFLAKALRAGEWRYPSIPPGGSAAYNANPLGEKPPGPST
jgi:hypothetical protein